MFIENLHSSQRIEGYFSLLEKIYKVAISSQQEKVLNSETLESLNASAANILEQRRRKQDGNKPEHVSREACAFKTKAYQPKIVEPLKLDSESSKRLFRDKLLFSKFLDEELLPFLKISEMTKLRLINRNFNLYVLSSLSLRLKIFTISFSKTLDDRRVSNGHEELYKRFCKSLIPPGLSELFKAWLNDVSSITLEPDDFESVKRLRSFPGRYDILFAAFNIFFGLKTVAKLNSLTDDTQPLYWFPHFQKSTSDPRLLARLKALGGSSLSLSKTSVLQLEAHAALLMNLDVKTVEKWSPPTYRLFKWCVLQAWEFVSRNIFIFRPNRPALDFFGADLFSTFKEVKLMQNLLKVQGKSILNIDSFNNYGPVRRHEAGTLYKMLISSERVMSLIFGFLKREERLNLAQTCSEFSLSFRSFEEKEISMRIHEFEVCKLDCIRIYRAVPALFELGFFSESWSLVIHLLVALKELICKRDYNDQLKTISCPTPCLELASKLICTLLFESPQRKKVLADGTFINNYFPSVKLICSSRRLTSKFTNFNPFQISLLTLKEIQKQTAELRRQLKNTPSDQNPIKHFNRAQELLEKKMADNEELRKIKKIYDEKVLSYLKGIAFDHQIMIRAIERAKGTLTSQYLELLRACKTREFPDLSLEILYINPLEAAENFCSSFLEYERSKKLWVTTTNKAQKTNSLEVQKSASLFSLPGNQDIITRVMDFLEIKHVPAFGTASKYLRKVYNNYIKPRAHTESERLKSLELSLQTPLRSIIKKRALYYKTNNKPLPNKEHAIALLCEITAKDISLLKKNFKGTDTFNFFIKPFITLFQLREKRTTGEKKPAWRAFHAFLLKNDVYKLLNSYVMETLSSTQILKIEKYTSNELYSPEEAAKSSESLGRLAKWILGLIEIHKYLRRFSVSLTDLSILNEEERRAAELIDSEDLIDYEEIGKFYRKDVDLILTKKPSVLTDLGKGSEEKRQDPQAVDSFPAEHASITKLFSFHFPMLSKEKAEFVSIEMKVPIDQQVSAVIEAILREFLLYFLRNSLPIYEFSCSKFILHPAFKNGLPKTHYPSLDPNQILARTGICKFIVLPGELDLKETGGSYESIISAFNIFFQKNKGSSETLESPKDGETTRKRCASDCSPPTTSEETGLDKMILQRNKSHGVNGKDKKEKSSKELDSSLIARISYSSSSLIKINDNSNKKKISRNHNARAKARSENAFVKFFFSCMTENTCSK